MQTDTRQDTRKIHFMGNSFVGNTACGRYVDTFGVGSAFRAGDAPQTTADDTEVTCRRCQAARAGA